MSLAHDLNMQVVAEGVETTEELKELSVYGCGFAQGYGISKPKPADELAEFLSQRFHL